MKPYAVLVFLALLPVPARAQSQPTLAEVAEKEKARRAAAKAPKKVYTEDDLHRSHGTANVQEGAAPAEASPVPGADGKTAGADGKPAKTDAEARAEKRADFQKRLDTELKVKAAVQQRMDDAQRELSDVRGYSYGDRRPALQKVIDDGKVELAKIDQTIAQIEDDARRQGVSLSR